MTAQEFLREYWWLSVITIPLLALVIRFLGRPSRSLIQEWKIRTFAQIFFLLTIINFGVWAAGTIALHGDALTGKAENGRYYVQRRGQYTEVSHAIYLYSRVHTGITLLSVPAVAILFLTRKRRDSQEESPGKADRDPVA